MIAKTLCLSLMLAAGGALADEAAAPAPAASETVAAAAADGGTKRLSGMSILGNQEAPKSLVIVPWKSSEIGDSLGISAMLDGSRRPVDKDVFMRELAYYEIRSE
ncbi:MAG TPA: hypothetical protein VFR29_02150 [Steroidobacteraceae bacterium]|nr:hypothetical protein [Steroidobacteraceae bacterium]